MESKRIDIDVSHNHPVNKFVHFWSSIIMIFYTYPYIIYEDYFNDNQVRLYSRLTDSVLLLILLFILPIIFI